MSIHIFNSSFCLSSLSEGEYPLSVLFSDSFGETVSSKSCIFSPVDQNSLQGCIWDVYSQNVSCEKVRQSQFFSFSDVEEMMR